jgi:hypothetical protein
MGADSLREVIIGLTFQITMENDFTKSEESIFLAPNLLVHFREELHRMSRESLESLLSESCLAELML